MLRTKRLVAKRMEGDMTHWLTSKLLSEALMNSRDWFSAYVSIPHVSRMFTPRVMSL